MKSYWQCDLTGRLSDDSGLQTAAVANAGQWWVCEVLQRGRAGSSGDNRRLCFAGMADAIHRNDSSRMETPSQSQLNRSFSTPDELRDKLTSNVGFQLGDAIGSNYDR
jgi:hypothetical protein